MGTRGTSLVGLALVAALTACGPGVEPTESTTPTASAPAAPSPTDDPSEDAGASLGAPIEDVDAYEPGDAGLAWQTADGVVFTNLAGTPLAHLPGWTLDRATSDRLAAPVVVGPDGDTRIVTSTGVVPLDGPWALAEGWSFAIEGGDFVVRDARGTTRLSGGLSAADVIWVSATGTVLGIGDSVFDVEEVAPLDDVIRGCRVADRHTPEDPLFVCDDGQRLAGDVDLEAPGGGRWGWVTVGTSGDEILATVTGGEAPGLYVGSRSAGTVELVIEGGAALFYRSSGAAWVARLGVDAGLATMSADRAVTVTRDVPGATDVAIWTR